MDSAYTDLNNIHDVSYKSIFKVKKNFLHFLKKYVSLNWMKDLTESDIEESSTKLFDEQFKEYEADLYYKVKLQNGETIYLYILFELQSYNDFTMPYRLLVYMTLKWMEIYGNTDKNLRKQESFKFPAIVPIVFYSGTQKWTASRSFKKTVNSSELFGKYITDFEYVLVELHTLDNNLIQQSNEVVDNILLCDKLKTKKAWEDNIGLVYQRIQSMDSDEDRNECWNWVSNVFGANALLLKKFLDSLRKGDVSGMGNALFTVVDNEKMISREEGREEGREEIIIGLYKDGDNIIKIARVANKSEDEIKQILTSNGIII